MNAGTSASRQAGLVSPWSASSSDLQFFKTNIRRSELEAIAQAVGAEVVILPRGSGEHNGQGGGRRRHRQKQAEAEE